MRSAPWPPLAALLGVAGLLWLGADVWPNIAPNGASALRPAADLRPNVIRGSDAGAASQPRPVAADGSFTLCALERQPNCVVDGDTIWYGGVKIRLENIDTPETFEPRCAAEAALGRRATERLLELVNAGPFEVAGGGRDEDIYGRKLRVLLRDGRSLGEMLVAERPGAALGWRSARLVRLKARQAADSSIASHGGAGMRPQTGPASFGDREHWEPARRPLPPHRRGGATHKRDTRRTGRGSPIRVGRLFVAPAASRPCPVRMPARTRIPVLTRWHDELLRLTSG